MRVVDNGIPPHAAILDLDGTLYAREAYVDGVVELVMKLFRERGGKAPSDARRLAAQLRAKMETDWSGTSITEFVLDHGGSRSDWTEFRNQHFTISGPLSDTRRVIAAIGVLRSAVRVALVTNNAAQAAERVLQKIGLAASSFDAIVDGERSGTRTKPHEGAFRLALEKLGVPATACYAIGDKFEIDVAPLVAMGGSGIEITGPSELPVAADYVVRRAARASE